MPQIYDWPLVPKSAGSNPAEAVGFLGRINPQHAFLRRGSKAVGPMSYVCRNNKKLTYLLYFSNTYNVHHYLMFLEERQR